MAEILLQNKNASMQIDTCGAYIDTLHLAGKAVLYPKTRLNVGGQEKLRGGMHVCLPQFGPDANNNLAQHGFGRTSSWQIKHHNESSISLSLQSDESGYENVEWLLDYSLPDETAAIATLTIRNKGDAPIRTSPGFHPYFSAQNTAFDFNGKGYDADCIAHTEFVQAPEASQVSFDNMRLKIHTHNLPVYALWSDRNGQYTCAEPTAEGNAFLAPAQHGQFVAANSEKSYSLTIKLSA